MFKKNKSFINEDETAEKAELLGPTFSDLKGIFCCLIISAVFVNCLYGCGAGRPSRRVDVLNGFLWLDGLFRPSPIHHLTPWWWGTQNSNGQQKGAHAQKPNRATVAYAGGYRWV